MLRVEVFVITTNAYAPTGTDVSFVFTDRLQGTCIIHFADLISSKPLNIQTE